MKQFKERIYGFLFIGLLFVLVSLFLSVLYFLLGIGDAILVIIGLLFSCGLYFLIGMMSASIIKTKAFVFTLVLVCLFIVVSLFSRINPFYMTLLKAVSCLLGCWFVNQKTNHC